MSRASVRPVGLARFYPIVPDVGWLERIAPLGIATVQLRLKDAAHDEVNRQIKRSLDVCRAHGVQLIVNDYWREAIEFGAKFVHLGQEDLAASDVAAIRAAGIRIGISTHDEAELAIALAAEPDYVALGPVYETKLKAMKWAPQGLARVKEWRERIDVWALARNTAPPPLVAIGGLTPVRASAVFEAGANTLAVITDFLSHSTPEGRIAEWIAFTEISD